MADLFEKVFDSIDKGVNSIAAGSKNMLEKAKINNSISGLENDKRAFAEQIGVKAYNLYKENKLQNLEELEELCKRIDQLNEQIALKQEEIKTLDQPAPAPPAYMPPQSAPEAPSPALGDMPQAEVYCPSCGNANKPMAKFCAHCGSKL